MRLAAGVLAARAASAVIRRSGRGGGTSLPGKLLTRIEPRAIGRLAARLPRGSAVISATNGKTTTAAMVAAILDRGGVQLVSNRAGANMAGGIAAALAAPAARGAELGLFEVDEFWLGEVVAELRPRALLLANLFRDQLDRYGELDTIADRWAAVAATTDAALVLCADDPLVADLGRERAGVRYFGVDDPSLALPGLQHASDSKHCRNCGAAYRYGAVYLGHLGDYACPGCGRTRPQPSVVARAVTLDGVRAARFELVADGAPAQAVALPLPGLYNVYNALAAAALCLELGAPLGDVVAGLQAVRPAFGRAEVVVLDGRRTALLLVKNPAGANEVLRTLALEGDGLELLCVLNDRIADGRDVSWVWDADWERLAGHVGRAVCAGTRAAEMALRLKYAGVPEERLEVVEALPAALDRAVGGGSGPLYALPTYTAMLELRDELAARGAVKGSFA